MASHYIEEIHITTEHAAMTVDYKVSYRCIAILKPGDTCISNKKVRGSGC